MDEQEYQKARSNAKWLIVLLLALEIIGLALNFTNQKLNSIVIVVYVLIFASLIVHTKNFISISH